MSHPRNGRARASSLPYYCYCVLRLEPDEEFEVFEGIGGHPVFPVREGRLAMLLSRLDHAVPASPHWVVEHSRVVHRVFQQHTVLPFRFGTAFETEQQVCRLLAANRAKFQEAIHRLRGKVEMHVKIVFPTGSYDGSTPPELEARCRLLLAPFFGGLETDVSARSLSADAILIQFNHLLDASHLAAYRQAFERASQQLAGCEAVMTGPWPPCHFIPDLVRMPSKSASRPEPARPASAAAFAGIEHLKPRLRAAKA